MNKTYKRAGDRRTRFWVAVYECDDRSHNVFVADCLKSWFERCYPDLVASTGGWLVSWHGKSYITIPHEFDFDWGEFDRVMSFLGIDCFWPKVPGHDINDFSLDLCVTRDYSSDPNDQFNQTEHGKAFCKVKYDQRISIDEREHCLSFMTLSLIEMIRCVMPYAVSDFLITHIPTEQNSKHLNLGYQLAERVSRALGVSMLSFGLSKPKQEMKSLRLDEKHYAWERIYSEESFADSSVIGKCIVIVDDLYQSGTSMWAYAKQLKAMGASKVIGVACVKSARDTDNVREG